MYDGTRLPSSAFGPLRLCDGGSYQLSNTRRVQIRQPRYPDVPNVLALATQQAIRIGQQRPKVEAEVDPAGMRSGEDERVAGPLGEPEVVGDGVHLVNELVGCRSLFEDQLSGGQSELLNLFAVRQEESDVFRIRWTLAHSASVPDSVRRPSRAQ